MEKIRIIIADDHTILREGIRRILDDEPDCLVIGEAADGREAVRMTLDMKPDIVLMDVGMPLLNGLEATRQIKSQSPEIRVLVLTMHDNEEYIRFVLAAGASGYILKDSASLELVNAIRAVNAGESVLSPAITRLVIEDYLRWGGIQPDDETDRLTPREREVFQLIAEGYLNKQIAEILCVSIKTVQTHRANLMAKLDLHDRAELVKYAIQKKVIDI